MKIGVSTCGDRYVYIDPDGVESYYFSTKDGEYPNWRVRMKSGDIYWIHFSRFDEIGKALDPEYKVYE